MVTKNYSQNKTLTLEEDGVRILDSFGHMGEEVVSKIEKISDVLNEQPPRRKR